MGSGHLWDTSNYATCISKLLSILNYASEYVFATCVPGCPCCTHRPAVNVAPALVPYTNIFCGFSLDYPSTLTKFDNASGSAIFTNTQNANESIAITCQEDIPRPSLTAGKIDSMTIWNTAKTASVAAKLYHDSSPKDGSPMDALIFYYPKKSMDVFIAGFGSTFNQILQTVQLLP